MQRSKADLLMVPLEPYKQRYTEHLSRWEERAFFSRFNTEQIVPEEVSTAFNILSGEVLDRVQRPRWALAQIQSLLKRPELGKIWFSDFYHPRLDALAYTQKPFQAFSFCWAQTFDQYDFTRKYHTPWMRPWEVMALELYSAVFVASSMLKDLIVTVNPSVESKVHVVGLPFDSQSVTMVAPQAIGRRLEDRRIDVVYTSRFDEEKNPGQFLDLVDMRPDLACAICTGSEKLRGSDFRAVERALQMQQAGKLSIYTNLTKAEYYSHLGESKIQFNGASQDWVSFTLLEALCFGCIPCYPMTRSFPEALMYASEFMYVPGNMESAADTIEWLLTTKLNHSVLKDIIRYHDGSLSSIATIIDGL